MRKQVLRRKEVPGRLVNAALMVEPREAELILSALKTGYAEIIETDDLEKNEQPINSLAVISVLNGLTYRGYGWWQTSYVDIRREFRAAMADDSVKAIVFDISSGGGEVAGVFDLVDEIYAARGKKPIFAVANEDAYSAAYAIASAADRVFVSRTAGVGSIGVIAIHADWSKYYEDAGIKFTTVFAGDRKADFNPNAPITDEAVARLKVMVDSVYELFLSTVARNRNMSIEAVRATQATTFDGKDAVMAGLADSVLSWTEAIEKILTIVGGGTEMKIEEIVPGVTALMQTSPKAVEEAMASVGYVPAASIPDVEKIKLEAKEDGVKLGIKTGADAAVEIIEMCDIAGKPELAAGFIREQLSMDDVKAKLVEARAKKEEGGKIISTVSALSVGAVNPLLENAKKRAGAK